MAIRNTDGSASGLLEDTGLPAITSSTITGLCLIEEASAGGEAFLFEFRSDTGKYLGMTYDVNAGPKVAIRLSWDGGWNEVNANFADLNAPFAWGVSCSGTGANQLTVMLSTGPSATPLSYPLTLGGSTWTPDDLRLLFNTVQNRGIRGWQQNVKYGSGSMSAAQMHAEAWNLAVQNPGLWTPVVTEMVAGDLTAQREGFVAVNAGSLAVVPGYFTDTGGSTATITVSTATVSGDALTATGSYTSDSLSQTITVELVSGGVIAASANAVITGSTWACTIDNVPAATYTVRGRIVDSLGSSTDIFGSTITIVGLSGGDQLPYLYTVTGLLAQPTSLTLPAGTTALVRALDQSGNPISGASVSMSSGVATAPALTDMDGYVVVTGVTNGSGVLTLSVVIQNGSTASATVPITVSGTAGVAITVTPASAQLAVGQTQQFTASNPGGGGETWTVVSGGGSISAAGLYTAPASQTTAVIRGARTANLSQFDESTITVTEAQSSIGGGFLGNGDQSVSPGGSLSWRIVVQVDGQAYQGALVSAVASDPELISITPPISTIADGTTTVNATIPQVVETGRQVSVQFTVTAGDLTLVLNAIVSIVDAPNGYLQLRGVLYPRPYSQKT